MDLETFGQYLQGVYQELQTLNRTLMNIQATMMPGRDAAMQAAEEARGHPPGIGAGAQQGLGDPPGAGAQQPTQQQAPPAGAADGGQEYPPRSVDELKALFEQMRAKFGTEARNLFRGYTGQGGPTMIKKDDRGRVYAWMEQQLTGQTSAAAGAPALPGGSAPPPGAGTSPPGFTPPNQGGGFQAPGGAVVGQPSQFEIMQQRAKGYLDGPQTAVFMSTMLNQNKMSAEHLFDLNEEQLGQFLTVAESSMREAGILS